MTGGLLGCYITHQMAPLLAHCLWMPTWPLVVLVYRFVEMSGINDDEVPCCSKDVKREDESLLQKFVPVNVYSESSVRRMMSRDESSRRVTTHECSLCGFHALWRSDLVRHTRTHTGEKPYQCELCQKQFNVKSNLNRHILTHKDIRTKRFQCDLCEYKAATKQNLVRHRLTHTGKKPFACTLCDFKASSSSSVTKHMLTHTGDKPFACSECDYRTVRKVYLTVHMRTHTNEKPFGCDYCSFRSASSGGRSQHMKRCRERPSTSEE